MSGNVTSEAGRLAVLIDADNASAIIADGLLAEVARYGVASVKRIYGDWTDNRLGSWKECLLRNSIQPIQQFGYTKGKNATDSAMIIDAMDLLYTRRFDGFCIVSSDSDFTRLASRIREDGLQVYGFGERKTPQPFVVACHKFIYTELLSVAEAEDATEIPGKHKAGNELRQDTRLLRLLRSSVEAVSDEDGWAQLGPVGSHIAKQAPDFDVREYGFSKLSGLVVATELFDVTQRTLANNRSATYIRDKRKK